MPMTQRIGIQKISGSGKHPFKTKCQNVLKHKEEFKLLTSLERYLEKQVLEDS